jgi:hypothetical protein
MTVSMAMQADLPMPTRLGPTTTYQRTNDTRVAYGYWVGSMYWAKERIR